MESIRLPSFSSGVVQVWRRSFLQFKRFWMMNFFWIVLEPLLLLLAVGYGLGSFVSDMKGVSYIEFFFPALICMSSMLVAFFESTYGNFAKLTYQKTYSTMILTTLDPKQIVVGEVLWAGTKGTFSAFAIGLVAGTMGLLNWWMFLPILLVVFISSLAFASIGMLVTSAVKSYDGIIYPTSGIIVPMSLFCGTYFPIEQLGYGLQYLVYAFPLTHSVAVVRSLNLESFVWWQMLIHILFLIIIGAVCIRWAIRRISEKLVI